MLLRLENITYRYNTGTPREVTALDDISIDVGRGEYIGLIGHTGSGKSTLIQHFNGLVRPTSGRVLFEEEDIWADGYRRRELRFRVGLVFQYPEHQLFETDVITDVSFGPKNRGLSAGEARGKAEQALKDAGVPEEYYKKSPFELSGGQKRRAAIAGVLAMDPDVLILDEPTAGLDPRGRKEILALIGELRRTRGITIILVSHSMEDVADHAGRIIVINQGKKAFDGTPKEVFAHYKELEEMHLSAPQVTYVLRALKERGLPVEPDVFTLGEAKASILAAKKRCSERSQ